MKIQSSDQADGSPVISVELTLDDADSLVGLIGYIKKQQFLLEYQPHEQDLVVGYSLLASLEDELMKVDW